MEGKVVYKAVGLWLAAAFALAACGAFAAVPHHVSAMQESPWLDTEVFTNVAFNSSGRELRKIDVDMQFVEVK